MDGRVEQRNLHGNRHGTLFEQREHLLAVDLLENHRHAADDGGLDLGHRLEQNLGRGDAAQQRDVAADGQRCQEVEGAAVGVGQRQERERAAAPLEVAGLRAGVERRHGEEDVAREVVDRQHDPLRVARGARRVVEQDDLVVGYVGVPDVVDAESARILRAVVLDDVALVLAQRLAVALVDDVEVGEREDRLNLANLVLLDVVPVVVAQEEQAALRVVDDVDDVGRGEVLEDGDDDRAVGDGSDIGDAPPRVVASYQGDFVAALDACLLEEQVELGNLLGHLVVGKLLFLEVVGQSGHLTVLAEALFVNLNQVLL